jgi:hypothetical protein
VHAETRAALAALALFAGASGYVAAAPLAPCRTVSVTKGEIITIASGARPEGNGNIVGSAVKPEGGGAVTTASVAKREGSGSMVYAQIDGATPCELRFDVLPTKR